MATANVLLAGIVYADGGSWSGTGFTVAHPATGTYVITYTGSDPVGIPVPIVTGLVNNNNGSPADQSTDNIWVVQALGANPSYFQFTVFCYDLYNTATGQAQDVLQDAPFNFAVFNAGT